MAKEGSWPAQLNDLIPRPYRAFWEVFSKESFGELPDWKQWDHAIELTPDAQKFSTKVNFMFPVK